MNKTATALALAIIATWLALWFSAENIPFYLEESVEGYFKNPPTAQVPIAGAAGWPFTTFLFPPPALGNDIPPDGSFFPFALNVMVFFVFLRAVLQIIPQRLFRNRYEQIAVRTAFVTSLVGLLWVILRFD